MKTSEPEQIRQKIRKMHFLVHPGYLSQERAYQNIMDKYDQKLRSLPHDEVAIIFLHFGKKPMRTGEWKIVNAITSRIEAIASRLGKQAIVLSADTPLFETDRAIRIIR